jgi:BirA family biotin operon repressor/biotin-[acetyl-CoA-carboxylase] ligase
VGVAQTSGREFSFSERSLGAPIVRLSTVASTMDVARDLDRLGAAEGTTIVAARQTDGRGRAGRTWQSPRSTGLYCSILLRPRISSNAFLPMSIAAGLALCDALDADHRLGLQIKWPNDVIVAGCKLAGILITTNLAGSLVESAILGIGLNLAPDSSRPPQAISFADVVGDLSDDWGDPLPQLISALQVRYAALIGGDPGRALGDWAKRLAYLDENVVVQDGPSEIGGCITGVSLSGSLQLQTSTGPVEIFSGELTRGPKLQTDRS